MKVVLFWLFHWWREYIPLRSSVDQRLFMLIATLGLVANAVTAQAVELKRTSIGSYVDAPVTWEVSGGVPANFKVTFKATNLRSGKAYLADDLNCSSDQARLSCSFNEAGIYTIKIDNAKEIIQIISLSKPSKFDSDFETLISSKGCSTSIAYDVIVVDGTSAGIGAALAAADMGLNTCLLEPTSLLGGMFTNGIGITDIGVDGGTGAERGVLSGLSYGLLEEFRKEVMNLRATGTSPTELKTIINEIDTGKGNGKAEVEHYNSGLNFRPSLARQALYNLLTKRVNAEKLHIELNSEFKTASKVGGKFESLTDSNNKTYKANYVIDATDSGDVAVFLKNGSATTSSNENDSYCKTLNNTTVSNGLINDIATDSTVPLFCVRKPPQAYSFVMTIKEYDGATNWSSMANPPPDCYKDANSGIEGEYNPDLHLLSKDGKDTTWTYLTGKLGEENGKRVHQVKHHKGLGVYTNSTKSKGNCPDNSVDYYAKLGDELIDCDTHGLSVPTDYANKPKNRPAILERYLNHTMCLLYHAQHDKNVGLTESEDPLRGNFPTRLYVREGRRINGEAAFYTRDALIAKKADPKVFLQDNHRPVQPYNSSRQSIGLSSYTMDTHGTSPAESAHGIYLGENTGVGMIPLGVMIPKDDTLSNVLVPLAVSSSTFGYSTLRMDPTRLYMGEVAALAIKTAKDDKKSIKDILSDSLTLFKMQEKLISERHARIFLCQDVKGTFESKEAGTEVNGQKIVYDDMLNLAFQFLGVWQFAQGYPNYMCLPNNKITRAEFTKIAMLSRDLAKHLGDSKVEYKGVDKYPTVENCFPKDATMKDHWGLGYICAAKDAGVITGYPARIDDRTGKEIEPPTFKPNNNITFAEMMKIVLRSILGETDITSVESGGIHWATNYFDKANATYGDIFINPKNCSKPANPLLKDCLNTEVTRGDVALVVYKAIKRKLENPNSNVTFNNVN